MLFLKIILLKNMASLNRKLINETVVEKNKALKDIGKRLFNKRVAKKFVVPRNTESTWVKNKEKLDRLRQCHGLFPEVVIVIKL